MVEFGVNTLWLLFKRMISSHRNGRITQLKILSHNPAVAGQGPVQGPPEGSEWHAGAECALCRAASQRVCLKMLQVVRKPLLFMDCAQSKRT